MFQVSIPDFDFLVIHQYIRAVNSSTSIVIVLLKFVSLYKLRHVSSYQS